MQELQMRNILEILPGEHLSGFVGRVHHQGLYGVLSSTTNYLGMETSAIRPQRFFHADDLILSRSLMESDPLSIWRQHGFGHYIWPFLSSQDINEFLMDYSWRTTKGQYCIAQNYWRWCSACAVEDCDTEGISYFHRDHQIPGVFHCHKHQVPLSGLCDHCGFHAAVLGQLVIPPVDNRCPGCDYSMSVYDGHFTAQMLDIERQSIEITNATQGLHFKQCTRSIRKHMGLANKDLTLLKNQRIIGEWFDEFADHIGSEAVSSYFSNAKPRNGQMTSSLLRNPRIYDESSTQGPLHPLVHLLALQFAGQLLPQQIPEAA